MEFDKSDLVSLLAIMGSVITALWMVLRVHQKRDADRLTKFEELHEKNQGQIVELTGDHRELKGRIDTIEKISGKLDGIERLSQAVLEEVKKQEK